ncbi:protein HEG [Oryzias melastigma]|uniref:Heart development protein with EGF-like domains 1 n=1 Tax=Oryzias melastigma TaxID=30732 RepID=A0A3B3CUZ7_ORYME|nr:protein HEG [Oryzias melastigma]
MEAWFLNHLFCVWLWVLLLELPGPLGAGTPTYNSTNPVTGGFYHSGSTDGLSNTDNGVTSASFSSESLSPSQRILLLSHSEPVAATAADFDSEQTKAFTETSNVSPDVTDVSTEPLTFTTDAVSSSSDSSTYWKELTDTNHISGLPRSVSWEPSWPWAFSAEDDLLQDAPSSQQGASTALMSHSTSFLTDGTYTTTISRAGERTLLSVTSSNSNSTSSALAEDSNSHQPPSTWGMPPRSAEPDYTKSESSTRANGGETPETETFTESGTQSRARGTPSLSVPANATQQERTSASQEVSASTLFLKRSEPDTGQSHLSVSSSPPVTSPLGGLPDNTGTNQASGSSVQPSTESSTEAHSSSTQNQGRSEEVSFPQTSEGMGLTAAPSTVRTVATEAGNPLTDAPLVSTADFLTTTPVTVTKSQITEGDASTAMEVTSTLLTSTSSSPPSTSSGFRVSPSTYFSASTLPQTAPSPTSYTLTPQTSVTHPGRHLSPGQTQRPATGTTIPTKASTMTAEASGGTLRSSTAHTQFISTASTHSTPTQTAGHLHTTQKQADRGGKKAAGTTPPVVIQLTKGPTRDPCVLNPCMNGGMCKSSQRHQFTCRCQQGWKGRTCNQDVDECKQQPCPADSTCINTRGSFSCECPLGFDLEDGRSCTRAKTFLGTFSFDRYDPSIRSIAVHELQREIIQLLNVSLSVLRGYSRSTLSKWEQGGMQILAVNMFSLSTDVTTTEVFNSIQMSLNNCSSSLTHCRMFLQHRLSYHTESLCQAQRTRCDPERTVCSDSTGTASCQCLQGYYKHNSDDLSCLECGDGYKLENGTCVPCMFGFGGFNCGNFYKLIAVVVSPAGGALLLILIIALIVTCCKSDKNDINKIIFRSGDMQMSPYADFQKNNRISMEWGRETIEMQENGSTKNLLQMTDIYYSPALRNSDLERNGLYPFTGLPGSRHSCIYPAQWNPSFTSDDSRRRDYF